MKRAPKDPVVVAIIVIGMVAVVTSILLIRRNQEDVAARWLDQRAEIVGRATVDTIDETLRDLHPIGAFMDATPGLNQAQFAAFVETRPESRDTGRGPASDLRPRYVCS